MKPMTARRAEGLLTAAHLPAISPRTRRLAPLILTAVILAFAALSAMVVVPFALSFDGGVAVGMDFGIYMDRTDDWLAGDGFYRSRQLTGQPYQIQNGDSFYPPTLLYLLLPFALGVPAILWWLIPTRGDRRRVDPHPSAKVDLADHGVRPASATDGVESWCLAIHPCGSLLQPLPASRGAGRPC